MERTVLVVLVVLLVLLVQLVLLVLLVLLVGHAVKNNYLCVNKSIFLVQESSEGGMHAGHAGLTEAGNSQWQFTQKKHQMHDRLFGMSSVQKLEYQY